MAEIKNKDWEAEQRRVDEVLQVIDDRMEALKEKSGTIKDNIVELRKTFWDDVTVNLDDPDDVIETHTSIRQQAELLAERERSHGLFSKQWRNLSLLKRSPYFGRIDFKEEGEERAEPIYIGLFSLIDEETGEFLIYDWRAPISSMYYDYALGPAEYETMDGPIRGQIELKRQYIIRNGVIKGMFDTGVTIGDEILQQVLSKEADPQMKSIVASIQREQNTIIRHDKKKYLIVRGSAGSGKTSAALQRIAYFLYRYRGKLTSKNILLLSPNPLFSSYISNVLPELGEENMQQSTFFQYLQSRIGKEWDLEDPFSQMEFMLQKDFHGDDALRREGIRFKSSLHYKELLDRYIEKLGTEGMQFRSIVFRSEPFVHRDEIRQFFYSLNPLLPIPNRIQLVKEWLLNRIEEKGAEERKKEWVEEERDLMSREEYVKAYRTLQREQRFTENTFNDFEREEQLLATWIVNKRLKPLKRKVEELAFINLPAIYKGIFSFQLEEGIQIPRRWTEIGRVTAKQMNARRLPYEDATPFLYLKDMLEGRPSFSSIKHVFIDEAQDYSPFQMAYLKFIFPYSKMTILGDGNQSIFSYSTDRKHFLQDPSQLFPDAETEEIALLKSYRSTKQITDFALNILKDKPPVQPFNRQGPLPTLHQVENRKELHRRLQERVAERLAEGHETVAIICKTVKETLETYNELKDVMDVNIIKKDSRAYEKGVNIIPVYLAKGIEFDAVLIYNCSKDHYFKEEERTLFYAACTRAMHSLDLFTIGEVSPFFENIPPNLYVRKQ